MASQLAASLGPNYTTIAIEILICENRKREREREKLAKVCAGFSGGKTIIVLERVLDGSKPSLRELSIQDLTKLI